MSKTKFNWVLITSFPRDMPGEPYKLFAFYDTEEEAVASQVLLTTASQHRFDESLLQCHDLILSPQSFIVGRWCGKEAHHERVTIGVDGIVHPYDPDVDRDNRFVLGVQQTQWQGEIYGFYASYSTMHKGLEAKAELLKHFDENAFSIHQDNPHVNFGYPMVEIGEWTHGPLPRPFSYVAIKDGIATPSLCIVDGPFYNDILNLYQPDGTNKYTLTAAINAEIIHDTSELAHRGRYWYLSDDVLRFVDKPRQIQPGDILQEVSNFDVQVYSVFDGERFQPHTEDLNQKIRGGNALDVETDQLKLAEITKRSVSAGLPSEAKPQTKPKLT